MTALDGADNRPAFKRPVYISRALLNSSEVAELIRVPKATLRYWRHIGIGPRSFRMGPRRVLYRADDVEAWVAEQYAARR